MRFVKAAFIIAILLAGSAPVRADAPSAAFQKRVDELVRWIAANSDYPVALKKAPNFVFQSAAVIRQRFSGAALGYSADTSSIMAAQSGGAIYLLDTFELGRDDYILLHELVHHLQDENGKTFKCIAEREREAYLLQSRFVAETGTGEAPNDMYMLMLRCDVRLGGPLDKRPGSLL
jgi:hypothetical protein